MDVTLLPFNQFVGLQRSVEAGKLLTLPSGPQYLNHLQTVHASAQLALAEASSGEFLVRALGGAEGLVPVVRRLECKFRKPAHGALTSSATSEPGAVEQLGADLVAKGRALIAVKVEIHDETGVHALSAEVDWFITLLPA